MPQQTIIQSSFNSGEFSPLLAGRVDIAKYASSCRKLQNFIPLVQGPTCKRGGLRYIGEAKYPNKQCILIPFRRSARENYVLEFGDRYIRFWRDRGQVLKSGVPYEIASPYTLADIISADGAKGIQYVQSGDVLYLACPGVYPKKLTKRSLTNWVLEDFIPAGGPWDEPNTEETRKISASGRSGTVTLTANFDVFADTDVGRQVRLEVESYEAYVPWEADRDYPFGGVPSTVRSDSKVYSFVRARQAEDDHDKKPNSGNVVPKHTRGNAWDGCGLKFDSDGDLNVNVGILWAYRHCGYGIATITAVAGPRSVTATVQKKYPFPDDINTYRWTLGAWHGGIEYPSAVTFFRERLVWGGGNRIWMSRAGDFGSFEDKDYTEVTPECAITMPITSDRVDNITWVLGSGEALYVGTEGGAVSIAEAAPNEPLGPSNVTIKYRTSKGILKLQPARLDSIIFVHSSGKQLYELFYGYDSDSLQTIEATILAEHLTKQGIKEITWQDDRYILWCVRKDGVLLGFTYNKKQEVVGWHRHILGGSSKAESTAVVNAPDVGSEDLYVVASLTVDGIKRRYMAYLDVGFSIGIDKIQDSFFVDFGKTIISGTPITTVPTLEHLEGKTVAVLVDGATHPDCVVSSGKITLESPGQTIQVGLPYTAELETNNIEAGAASGTAQGANKTLVHVVPRIIESSGGLIGPNANEMQQLYARRVTDNMDTAPDLTTGDIEFPFHSQFEQDGRILIRHNSPLPFNLLALIVTVDTKR